MDALAADRPDFCDPHYEEPVVGSEAFYRQHRGLGWSQAVRSRARSERWFSAYRRLGDIHIRPGRFAR